ncbi:DUF3142 domain-containing protein [Phytopseudomonas punonensis]|nr:DUF3142 domain-containing protein [Pseudomonas punonensis]
MHRSLCCLCLSLLALLCAACSPPASAPLDQQVYIWQRQWQPAHRQVLAQTRNDFTTLRVLALQFHPKVGWARAYPDLQQLIADGRPVVMVIRLDGQLPQPDQAQTLSQTDSLLTEWQASGVNVQGVEIDHDCASARLPAYTDLLAALRPTLPAGLALSITALPTWLNSPDLEALLRQVDSSVLQVHAINDPRDGLFAPQQAQRWAEAYGKRSEKPFMLALPAYGVALIDASRQVESEAPLDAGGSRRELLADPQQVANLLTSLHERRPENLHGIIWFRLPLPGDRRAWPLATLQAVMHGQPLSAVITVDVNQAGPLRELTLVSNGNRDAGLPERVSLAGSHCEAADAVADYRLEQSENGPVFVRKQPARLAAGQRQALGWARCSLFDQGAIHVSP